MNFLQPSASSVAVNRINDPNASQILGQLHANGQIYLINPNGILFGAGAQVDVGGLVASTLDSTTATPDGDQRSFAGSGTGSVVNERYDHGRQRRRGTNVPATTPFKVNTLRITGSTVFDAPTLHGLVANAQGKDLTLDELSELAARISDYYHARGYPLARAVLPAQVIRDGVVDIQVIEARYDTISLDNHSRVRDSLLLATLAPLQGGQLIAQAPLDHALLLLSDISGVVVGATVKPGATVGTSALQVNTTAGPLVTGDLTLDNYGDRYTGDVRGGGTVNLIDPLHQGDVLQRQYPFFR